MTAPPLSLADEFPCRVRFTQGRVRHHTRQPDEQRWWELLEAACGKTGCAATGYSAADARREVPDCRGCVAAVDAQNESEQAA